MKGKKAGGSGEQKSDPYNGKYSLLDEMNIDGIFNRSLDINSEVGGYTQSSGDWSFLEAILSGGSGSGAYQYQTEETGTTISEDVLIG